jgi:GntR family transcriptional regulator
MTSPPVPRYRQVADQLRQAILAGQYEPGQPLPSETQLAQHYRLNRVTINKATRILANEGLIIVENGRGSFVKTRRPLAVTSAAYVARQQDGTRGQWTAQLQHQGFRGTQIIREVATAEASPEVANLLGLDEGEPVIVRRRAMLLDDEPVQLADSYYPASLAAGTELATRQKLRGGTIAVLERLGHEPKRIRETIATRMPLAGETALLDLPPGVPVLIQTRVAYDGNDRPIEVSETVLAGDRHLLTYDLPMRL